ncbi:MAG TPA: HYR domain-containing protein, partial [Pyrinomonadaceae bacterium]|nr:HYR domain-containing protein [Pyrinomonadaceae bacterium]
MKNTPRTPAPSRKLTAIIALALAVFCALPPRGARAAAGGLDPTFGDGGKVLTDFPEVKDIPADSALQPDGKLVVVGYTEGPTSAAFAVARYNADGTPDPAFGAGGKVTTSFPGYPATSGDYAWASSVALQPDGKIVVAGNGNQFLLARYNADGSLDPSFGAGGKVFSESTPIIRKAHDVAVMPDGKIVAAGSVHYFDAEGLQGVGFAMSRYNADGTPDESFGPGGKRDSLPFGGNPPDSAHAVILPGGGVYFASYYVRDPDSNFVLARYNADGTPDTTFGTGGSVRMLFSTFLTATALAVQPDGKSVLAGSVIGVTGYDYAARRYNADGTPDTTFGAGGVATADFGSTADFDSTGDLAGAVVVQRDGRVVVAGTSYRGLFNSNDFGAARFNADGSPDESFGAGGTVTADFGGYEWALNVAAQPDGKVVLAGWRWTQPDGDTNVYQFALARFVGGQAADVTPPSISCPAGVSAQTDADGCSAVVATGTPSASDDDGSPLTPAGVRGDGLALGDPYPLGETVITWTATDAAGNSASCTQSVTVADGTPPVISGASASPSALRPADHRMVD